MYVFSHLERERKIFLRQKNAHAQILTGSRPEPVLDLIQYRDDANS